MKHSFAFVAALMFVFAGTFVPAVTVSAQANTTVENSETVENETVEEATDVKTPKAEPTDALEVNDAQVSLIQNAFIAAPMAGVIAKIDVKEGDSVSVTTRLALLDDTQARSELLAAQAAFEAARLAAENDVDERYATRTLEVRKRELEQSAIANRSYRGAVSGSEIDKLRLVVDQSALAIEQATHDRLVAQATATEKQAAVRIVQQRLKKHGIETTVSGIVTEIDVEPGEWVEAGKPIVRVISLDPIRIECFVDGLKYGNNLVGKKATFTPTAAPVASAVAAPVASPAASAANVFSGKVTFVSPELHPVTGQVRLWATIENPNHKILAGMRGALKIETE